MAKIVISYAHQDRAAVENLCADLQLVGHTVWIDRNITGGKAWWNEVLNNIEQCEVFLLALSADSLASDACKRESYHAYRVHRALVPVQIASGVAVRVLPPDLQQLHIVDYVNQTKVEFAALVKAIQGAKWGTLPDPIPPRPAVPVSYLQRIQIRLNDPRDISFQDQDVIVQWLEHGLSRDDERLESLALMKRMRNRRDVDAALAARIDAEVGRPQPAPPTPPKASWGTPTFTALILLALVVPVVGIVVGAANLSTVARRPQAAAVLVVNVLNLVILFAVYRLSRT